MRYDKGHKDATRAHIIDVASAQFREGGVAAVGIAGIMTGAGLTNGAFYNHFESKEDLVEAVLVNALGGRRIGLRANLEAGKGLDATIRDYLSARHRDDERGRLLRRHRLQLRGIAGIAGIAEVTGVGRTCRACRGGYASFAHRVDAVKLQSGPGPQQNHQRSAEVAQLRDRAFTQKSDVGREVTHVRLEQIVQRGDVVIGADAHGRVAE